MPTHQSAPVPQRILVIRLSSIGDVVLTFPLLAALKNRFPGVVIDYLIFDHFRDLLAPAGIFIRDTLTLDRSPTRTAYTALRSAIRDNRYDCILDLHGNWRTRRLTFGLPVPVYRIRKMEIRRYLFVRWRCPAYPEIPVSIKYLQTAPWQLTEPESFRLEPPEQPQVTHRLLADLAVQPCAPTRLLIYPGARHNTKRWPPDYLLTLTSLILKQTNWNIVIAGDQADAGWLGTLTWPDSPRLLNLAGRYDLTAMIQLIALCPLILSNDSAPMHIAALAGKPQVAIFGSTVRRFGFTPRNPNAIILENHHLICRPCSHIGFARCPKGHFDCMRRIRPDEVFHALRQLAAKL